MAEPQRYPIPNSAPSRRDFLRRTGGGFGATALACLMAQDGLAAAASGGNQTTSPVAPRSGHHRPTAKSVIVLFMYGGPSQVDTFDPKPALAKYHDQPMPDWDKDELFKTRSPGKLMASSRQFTKRGQSGIAVSDLYPHLGGMVDDLAILRSCHADSFAHGSGLLQMNTGYLRQGYPSLGSWVVYGLGTENQNLPGFVVLLDQRGGPISGPPNWNSGFMPATYQGTQLRTSGAPILDLAPPDGVSVSQQRQQLDLLRDLNQMHAGRLPHDDELEARIAAYELAFRMQAHAPEAVDLSRETKATHALYGLDQPRTEPFGRRCLMARRLVERGVRFVQVYSGGGHNDDNWDAHSDVNANHELHAGETDRPIAGLLTDLKSRGLLDETLVIWTGEFGRTPTGQNGKGRDHNPRGFTVWMAGGGIQGGIAYGATCDFGYQAVEKPVHVHDLHATILHLLGLDHEALTYYHASRDMRLTDVHGQVLFDILRTPATAT